MPRKQHTHHYIYKTTCIVNGKYYIGMHSTSNLEDGYFGSGKVLRRSLNKHGKENHSIEILEWWPDRSSLKLREKEIVNEDLLIDPMCMNLVIGGEGGFETYNKNSEIQRSRGIRGNLKMKELRQNDEWSRNRSNSLSIGNKKAYSEGRRSYGVFYDWAGKSHSEQTRRKIGMANSQSQLGSRNSQFGKIWITNGCESKKILKNEIVPTGWKIGRTIKK